MGEAQRYPIMWNDGRKSWEYLKKIKIGGKAQISENIGGAYWGKVNSYSDIYGRGKDQ